MYHPNYASLTHYEILRGWFNEIHSYYKYWGTYALGKNQVGLWEKRTYFKGALALYG